MSFCLKHLTWHHFAVQHIPTCNLCGFEYGSSPTKTIETIEIWWLAGLLWGEIYGALTIWLYEKYDAFFVQKCDGKCPGPNIQPDDDIYGWSSRFNPDIVWDHISIGTVNHVWIRAKWLGGKREKKRKIEKGNQVHHQIAKYWSFSPPFLGMIND